MEKENTCCKCKCHNRPPVGEFIIGKQYEWGYVIDAVYTIDEKNERYLFNEIYWLWYFKKIEL